MSSRRRHVEEHENHERWLVSYADFITLLFAFFVVMYATSTQNEEKEKNFEDSVKKQFGLVASAQGQGSGQMGQIIQPFDTFPPQGAGSGEIEDFIQRNLKKSLGDDMDKKVSDIRHDAIGVRISLAAAEYFPSGSAKLRLPSLKSLDEIADLLKKTKNKIIVEGHTDDIPISGGNIESNWELGSLRATTIVRYLIKVHKIDPSRLAAISYADQKPLVPNDSENNRAKNRRIELLIVTDKNLDI